MPKQPQPKPIAIVRYIGGGNFIPGVPARDMTPDEWSEIPADLREAAVQNGLYLAEEM